MAKAYSGLFKPSHPEKYAGKGKIIYRSTWELAFMRMADSHPSVISWASEPMRIPYKNPLTNKMSMYVPDFIIMYENKNGDQRTEIIEIKPKKETLLEKAKTKQDKLRIAVNTVKWMAARVYCEKHGMVFRVLNEDHIFRNPK